MSSLLTIAGATAGLVSSPHGLYTKVASTSSAAWTVASMRAWSWAAGDKQGLELGGRQIDALGEHALVISAEAIQIAGFGFLEISDRTGTEKKTQHGAEPGPP